MKCKSELTVVTKERGSGKENKGSTAQFGKQIRREIFRQVKV